MKEVGIHVIRELVRMPLIKHSVTLLMAIYGCKSLKEPNRYDCSR